MVSELKFSVADWIEFLGEWNREALEALRRAPPDSLSELAQSALELGSILREPASEAAVQGAGGNLDLDLPESSRRFYRASNGLTIIGLDAEDGVLLPVEDVGMLRDRDPDLVLMHEADKRWPPDSEYFVYGPGQRTVALRSGYFRGLVQLSEWVDAALLLLNPEVKTPEGEWEAWYYGVALPGARRYRSFEDLMIDLRRRSIRNFVDGHA